MDLLSRITGATPIRKAEVLSADDIGSYSKRSEEVVSEVKHTLIEGLGGGMTLVIRGRLRRLGMRRLGFSMMQLELPTDSTASQEYFPVEGLFKHT